MRKTTKNCVRFVVLAKKESKWNQYAIDTLLYGYRVLHLFLFTLCLPKKIDSVDSNSFQSSAQNLQGRREHMIFFHFSAENAWKKNKKIICNCYDCEKQKKDQCVDCRMSKNKIICSTCKRSPFSWIFRVGNGLDSDFSFLFQRTTHWQWNVANAYIEDGEKNALSNNWKITIDNLSNPSKNFYLSMIVRFHRFVIRQLGNDTLHTSHNGGRKMTEADT